MKTCGDCKHSFEIGPKTVLCQFCKTEPVPMWMLKWYPELSHDTNAEKCAGFGVVEMVKP